MVADLLFVYCIRKITSSTTSTWCKNYTGWVVWIKEGTDILNQCEQQLGFVKQIQATTMESWSVRVLAIQL